MVANQVSTASVSNCEESIALRKSGSRGVGESDPLPVLTSEHSKEGGGVAVLLLCFSTRSSLPGCMTSYSLRSNLTNPSADFFPNRTCCDKLLSGDFFPKRACCDKLLHSDFSPTRTYCDKLLPGDFFSNSTCCDQLHSGGTIFLWDRFPVGHSLNR